MFQKKMPKCNLLSHGKTLPQTMPLRRSPRFLHHENAKKIDSSKRPNSRKEEVSAHFRSRFFSTDSTEKISPSESKPRRHSVGSVSSTNGSRKSSLLNGSAGNFQVLRRSPRFSNLRSTPENADKKTRFVDDVRSGCSTKWGSLEMTRKVDGRKRRVSLRLMCFAKGVEDSSELLGEMDFSKAARKGDYQKSHSSVKGVDDSCEVSRKCVFSEEAQRRDCRRRRRNSVRLMDSESVERSGDNLEKRVPSEVTQKGDCQKDRRSSHRLLAKKSSELSEKRGSAEASEKGNCQKERMSSVTLMVSANGVEKSEIGVNEYEKLGRKMEMKVRHGNSITSTVVMAREGEKKRRKIESGNEEIAVIEKRNKQSMEGCDFQGWTKDQEAALHRAYFEAKPSPHFWKKVSKMVPGKSAQECFDKVHSRIQTPTPQPRLRTNKMNWSPLGHFQLSCGKLLNTSRPDVKKPRSHKQNNILAQKTVRRLLQKHHLVDQGYEADMFSILETSTPTQAIPQTKMPITPDCVLKPHFCERSSLTTKKTTSKFNLPCCMNLSSPPVLKQVKNMALHEKYIDQLHNREARRKRTASARATNSSIADNATKESGVLEMDIKAAKTALVSDAKDAIMQFQHMQSIVVSDYKDFGDVDDDDECEEGSY